MATSLLSSIIDWNQNLTNIYVMTNNRETEVNILLATGYPLEVNNNLCANSTIYVILSILCICPSIEFGFTSQR